VTTLDLIPSQDVSVVPLDVSTTNKVVIWPGAGGAFKNTGNALIDGPLYIGSTNQALKNAVNAAQMLSLESQVSHLFLSSGPGANVHLAANAYYDGVNWQRYDVNSTSAVFSANAGGGFSFYSQAAGANPLSLASVAQMSAAGNLTLNGGNLYLRNDNGVFLTWNGTYIRSNVGLYTDGILQSVGRLITNNWDGGWSNNLGGTTYAQSHLLTAGRFATNGWWDTGYANSLGGNVLVNGFVYQRASGSYRCWDNGDFTYDTAASGSTLVQRDGSGYIRGTYINMSADIQGGAPVYVAGQNGDNYLRWYPKAS